ncbi:hypothetical protein LY90DRAFT_667724 [Neocallimastix californiae]|uniref:Protein kinase domain-containing protein n=1 Tax=Neocallimastix californiae TaxID=1754190 RepID=A0A1Y2E8W5_9FUNG|nr:hypothetical protein LY90DRAFT_667724 [Neocallimastix californiae]|eukprot:ORY67877.1 hypothetical protein LY90DRAFT_667724 [Neocallimastix californiae]
MERISSIKLLRNIYYYSEENIIYISDEDNHSLTKNDITEYIKSFVSINGEGNIFNLIPLGSRLTIWLDYYLDYEMAQKNPPDKEKNSILYLSNYLHDYFEDEELGEYSLSINTPGNIICFQSFSYYCINQLVQILFKHMKKIGKNYFKKNDNSSGSMTSLSKNRRSSVQPSNICDEIVLASGNKNRTSLPSDKLIETEDPFYVEKQKLNTTLLLETETSSEETPTTITHSSVDVSSDNLMIIPKLFSVYINKNYIKDERFIPSEKYKYKILKELVSTAHAQLYLVTEKGINERGGFSRGSLNLNDFNSNSEINYCETLSSSQISEQEIQTGSETSNIPLSHRKLVLKVIHLTNDKNLITSQSEKKYKKTIKEALFLRELNHDNIQKFITSWVNK